MREQIVKVYQFNELSDAAKERALERWRNGSDFFDDFITEEWTAILAACGWSEVEIAYSGFCSQGDGASFTGRFDGADIDAAKFRNYFTEGSDSDWILDGFREYSAYTAKLNRTSRHYSHENTVGVEWMEQAVGDDSVAVESDETESDFLAHCRRVMREIYRAIEREYDSQMSDEYIAETLEATEMEFTEAGDVF